MKKKGKAEDNKHIPDPEFLSDIGVLYKGILDLGESALPIYKEFADDVINERLKNINEIEYQLDYMLSFCFNSEILTLYKAVLRKLYTKHPDIVKFYIEQYFEMYGP